MWFLVPGPLCLPLEILPGLFPGHFHSVSRRGSVFCPFGGPREVHTCNARRETGRVCTDDPTPTPGRNGRKETLNASPGFLPDLVNITVHRNELSKYQEQMPISEVFSSNFLQKNSVVYQHQIANFHRYGPLAFLYVFRPR